MKETMNGDVQGYLLESVRTAQYPEAVSVMVASEDPEVVARVAPMVAARIYPEMEFAETLWQEPAGDGWSEAAVRVGRTAP